MRSRTGSSVGSLFACPCGSTYVVATAGGDRSAITGSLEAATPAAAREAIRRTEPSLSTTWVNSRISLPSRCAGATVPPGGTSPVRVFPECLSSAMTRLIEAMISSIEGSECDFASGMEATDRTGSINYLGIAVGLCQRRRAPPACSLRKTAAEADPLVLHLLVVPLHVVELHRQFELGRDQPAGRRSDVELGERGIVLCGDKLRLSREQRLVLDQNVEHGTGADQRLLLRALEGDLRRAHRLSKGGDARPRRLQGRPVLGRRLHRRPARVVDLAAPLSDRLFGLSRLRVDRTAFVERHRQLRQNLRGIG